MPFNRKALQQIFLSGVQQPWAMLYFLHIPKTAGTTLRAFVESHVRPKHLLMTYAGELSIDRPDWEFIERARRRRKELFAAYGHYGLGAHLLLEDPNPRYVCFMRDPVARIVSFFGHQERDPAAPLYNAIRGGLTLKEIIVRHLAPEVNNYAIRILGVDLGVAAPLLPRAPGGGGDAARLRLVLGTFNGHGHGAQGPFDQVLNRVHLQTAMRNIEKYFAFVGVSERMDESLLRLSKGLGWSSRRVVADRLNTAPKPHPPLDAATRELIHEHNQLDFELHKHFSASWFDRFGMAARATGT